MKKWLLEDGKAPRLLGRHRTRIRCQEPCRRPALYPDKRCWIHTEWLKGTVEQRKASPRSSIDHAWSLWAELQDPTIKMNRSVMTYQCKSGYEFDVDVDVHPLKTCPICNKCEPTMIGPAPNMKPSVGYHDK